MTQAEAASNLTVEALERAREQVARPFQASSWRAVFPLQDEYSLVDEAVGILSPLLVPDKITIDVRTTRNLHQHGYTNLDEAMIKDIVYLEQLASSTSTDITDWEVVTLLMPLERGNKRAINKAFFSQVENRAQLLGSVDPETFARIQRSLFETEEREKGRQLERAQDEYEVALGNIQRVHRTLNENVKRAAEKYSLIQRLEKLTPESCMSEFQKIMANPFYRFEKFLRNKATFITTSDLVMRYKNVAQQVDQTANFGQLRITLDISNKTISASRYRNNLVLTRFYHPFVGSDGAICFGDYGDEVYKMLSERRYSEVFTILASLLTTYDRSANPYISLSAFVEGEEEGDTRRVASVEDCSECGLDESRCGCLYCENCDEHGSHSTDDCEN